MSKRQKQEYKGNGNHDWEDVVDGEVLHNDNDEMDYTNVARLRVPGGWLYRTTRCRFDMETELSFNTDAVFVPMPDVVKHKV